MRQRFTDECNRANSIYLGIAFIHLLWYFVLLQEVKNVNELLKALYDSFYERPSATQLKAEVERCHQALIEKLDKPERRLVLQIIDCKDQIAEDLSIDSFICGFRLAWKLSQELNMYDKGRSALTDWVERDAL